MKLLILSVVVLFSVTSRADIKFIEVKSYSEESGLPPRLQVKFEIKCYQTLLRVIRNDSDDGENGKTTIAVGGLVRESNVSCLGFHEETVDAGVTYSGLRYEIVPIKK